MSFRLNALARSSARPRILSDGASPRELDGVPPPHDPLLAVLAGHGDGYREGLSLIQGLPLPDLREFHRPVVRPNLELAHALPKMLALQEMLCVMGHLGRGGVAVSALEDPGAELDYLLVRGVHRTPRDDSAVVVQIQLRIELQHRATTNPSRRDQSTSQTLTPIGVLPLDVPARARIAGTGALGAVPHIRVVDPAA